MYCPVENLSPLFTLGMNVKQRNNRVLSITITHYVIFYNISIYHQRMYSENVVILIIPLYSNA